MARSSSLPRRGDIFSKVPEADSALNLTKDYRVPLSESDSTKRSFSLERWHPDGGSLLLRAQDGYYVMAEGEEPELVWAFPGGTREEWGDAPSLSILQWTEDGRYLYASRSAKDTWDRGLVRYDVQNRQDELLVSGTDLLRSFSVAEDGSRMVFRRSDGDRPDEIWTADGDFGNARALTDMNPWLSDVALSRSQLIKYYDVDGEELNGVLHLPPDYQPGTAYPLVAEIYETFFDNGYNYSAQTLAAQGWMVLQPSVDLEEGFPGEAWMKGVTTAINSLMEKGMVDGKRLGIHGTSYGGYADEPHRHADRSVRSSHQYFREGEHHLLLGGFREDRHPELQRRRRGSGPHWGHPLGAAPEILGAFGGDVCGPNQDPSPSSYGPWGLERT